MNQTVRDWRERNRPAEARFDRVARGAAEVKGAERDRPASPASPVGLPVAPAPFKQPAEQPAIAAAVTSEAPASHDKLMDQVYRRQRHIYDATRRYFLLGRDTLIARLKPPMSGTVLEIGCGTGRNLIAAARAYPDARFFGLDISSAMLSTARANIRQAGLEARITLALGDATRFDSYELFGRVAFDCAFFSYSLSMIPRWRDALRQALEIVEPSGGRLLVVDFGEQEKLPGWFRRMLLAWLAKFHVEPRAELPSVLAALALSGRASLTVDPLYRDYARFAELAR